MFALCAVSSLFYFKCYMYLWRVLKNKNLKTWNLLHESIYKLLSFLIRKLYFQRIFALLWNTTFRGDNSIFVDIRLCYTQTTPQRKFVACNVFSLTLFGYHIYYCRGILEHVSKSNKIFRVVRVYRRLIVGLIYTLRLEL